MRFSVCNLGCKVNAYEAESIAASLCERGWQQVSFEEPADAALVFTCAVTNTAAAKSRKMMHRVKRLNKDCVIAMVGCYAQVASDELEEAEIIVGTGHKKDLPDLLVEFMETHKKIRAIDVLDGVSFESLPSVRFENRARGFLKIQDGCNQFCSYCIIPFARGRERSMRADEAVKEAEKIALTHREIVLTGIHTGRYRDGDLDLNGLIRRILAQTQGLARLRISSIEITEVSDSLLEQIATDERIARHLHIPLQAGSDKILRAMNRPYRRKDYIDRIQEIKERIPGICVSADVIVGFPGESEEDFADTVACVQEAGLAFLHVFPFSPRSGTVAEKMPLQVASETKKQRVHELLELSDRRFAEYMGNFVAKPSQIIAEDYRDGYTSGYTSQYIPVRVAGRHPHGSLVDVILERLDGQVMEGVPLGLAQGDKNETL